MNSLSWVLYLIEVISSLNGFVKGLASACVIVFVGFNLASLAVWDHNRPSYYSHDKDYPKFKAPFGFKWFSIPIVLFFLSTLLPSIQTMHLILASEMTEIVVMNEEVKGIANDLKDILKAQLEQFKAK